MPKALAVTKCPASCSMTETSNATMKMSTPIRKLNVLTLPPGGVPAPRPGGVRVPPRAALRA